MTAAGSEGGCPASSAPGDTPLRPRAAAGGRPDGRPAAPPTPPSPPFPSPEETLPPPRPAGAGGATKDPRGSRRRLCCRLFTLSRVEADSPRVGDEQGEGAQQTRQPPRHPHGSLRGGRARSTSPPGRRLSGRRPPGPTPHRSAPPCSPRPASPRRPAASALPSGARSRGKPPRDRAPSPPSPSPPLPPPPRLPPSSPSAAGVGEGGPSRPALPPASLAPAPAAGGEARRCPAAFRRWPSPHPHFKAGPGGPGPPPGGRSCPMAEGSPRARPQRAAPPRQATPAGAGPSAPLRAGKRGGPGAPSRRLPPPPPPPPPVW